VTDRRIEFSSLDRVCIACSVVKINIKSAQLPHIAQYFNYKKLLLVDMLTLEVSMNCLMLQDFYCTPLTYFASTRAGSTTELILT